MMKGALTLPKKSLTPMDVILKGLRPTMDDEHEKKKLKEWDEIRSGKIMNIFRRRKDGKSTEHYKENTKRSCDRGEGGCDNPSGSDPEET